MSQPRRIAIRKVIFLDIDGVLWVPGCRAGVLHPERVATLNHVAGATGAAVVVSSLWRVEGKFPDLRADLQRQGITAPIIGQTPFLTERRAGSSIEVSAPRSKEILAWLAAWESCRGLLETWLAIDDDALPDLACEYPDRVLRTDYHEGLTLTKGLEAVERLGLGWLPAPT